MCNRAHSSMLKHHGSMWDKVALTADTVARWKVYEVWWCLTRPGKFRRKRGLEDEATYRAPAVICKRPSSCPIKFQFVSMASCGAQRVGGLASGVQGVDVDTQHLDLRTVATMRSNAQSTTCAHKKHCKVWQAGGVALAYPDRSASGASGLVACGVRG